jgi:hypothetical protein
VLPTALSTGGFWAKDVGGKKRGPRKLSGYGQGPEENNWIVKEKRNRRIKEKGMLPRPNSSWVVGRTGFGPMRYRKVAGQVLHEGGPSGVLVSLGHTKKHPSHDSENAAKPVDRPTEALVISKVEVLVVSLRSEEFFSALHAREDSTSLGHNDASNT